MLTGMESTPVSVASATEIILPPSRLRSISAVSIYIAGWSGVEFFLGNNAMVGLRLVIRPSDI